MTTENDGLRNIAESVLADHERWIRARRYLAVSQDHDGYPHKDSVDEPNLRPPIVHQVVSAEEYDKLHTALEDIIRIAGAHGGVWLRRIEGIARGALVPDTTPRGAEVLAP